MEGGDEGKGWWKGVWKGVWKPEGRSRSPSQSNPLPQGPPQDPQAGPNATFKMTLLTQCPACQGRLASPKTLPCLHSFCSACLASQVEKSQPPYACIACRTQFGTSSSVLKELPTSSFVENLLTPEASSVDPTQLNCEICDKDDVGWFCQQCKQYCCDSCHRLHLKAKATSRHVLKSLDETLGTDWRKMHASTECSVHAGEDRKMFCKTCEIPACAVCVASFHNRHELDLLSKVAAQIRTDVDANTKKTTERQKLLRQNIGTLEESHKIIHDSAEKNEEILSQSFKGIQAEIDLQEAKLLQKLEDARSRKEKQIKLQKDDLDMINAGLGGATKFTEFLLNEGTDVELAENYKMVLGRLKTLQSIPFDSNIPLERPLEFFADNLELLKAALKGFGSVESNVTPTDPEKCTFELSRKEDFYLRFQKVAFTIVAYNAEGKRITKGGDRFITDVAVPANSDPISVTITDNKDGTYSGYLIPQRLGPHKISVRTRGKELPQSPITIEVNAVDYQQLSVPSLEFGAKGNGDGQFDSPRAVACNSKNQIIVADTTNHRIQVFDRTGRFLFKFGEKGANVGQLNGPYGVAVDEFNGDRIIVADTQNNRIQIFDASGKFHSTFGTRGSGDGEFSFPFGVAVDKQGHIAVADQTNHRIQLFNSDGTFLQKFGSYGTGPGLLNGPMGIAFDSKGNVVVAEHLNFRLQKFSPQGEYISVLGNWQLKNPYHLVIDEQDQILVSDFGNSLVRVFDTNDQILYAFGKNIKPTGIGLDKTGRVLVCDRDSNRILVY